MKAVSYNQRSGGHRKTLCLGPPQDPAQHHFWVLKWSTFFRKYIYHPCIQCSIICNTQDVEATLAFISVLMVEENVAYMYNVIYYSAIKKK